MLPHVHCSVDAIAGYVLPIGDLTTGNCVPIKLPIKAILVLFIVLSDVQQARCLLYCLMFDIQGFYRAASS